MERKGTMSNCCSSFLEKAKPYIAMICLQFGYAGMNIVTKVSLNGGMSHYVLVVYRHAFATAVIAPFALVLERGKRPPMTLLIFAQIFVLGLLGPLIDQNFYYLGLKYTSPTFSCAMSNMLPAMTFIMAVLCRYEAVALPPSDPPVILRVGGSNPHIRHLQLRCWMEKLEMKRLRCQAKVVGTIVTVAGAMLMTLYKGHIINLVWTANVHPAQPASEAAAAAADKDWAKGSVFLILATLAWAAFFILQAITLRRYSAQLSLTALVCFLGTLQSIVVTFVMEHKPSAWTIGWDMNLLAAAYAGIIASGVAYYVQGLVMEKRGPVFVTAFSPFMMVIVAFMGAFILAEKLYVGSILGAILIVMGLYAVLWGKYKEYKEQQAQEIPEVIKDANNNNNNNFNNQMGTVSEDSELNDVESQKNNIEASRLANMMVTAPMPQPPMIAMEAPKKGGQLG